MRQSIFDYVGNLDTLIAVVIGAILATGGALVAELIQERLNRKRRERDAARFFGEVLSSIDRILDFAFHSQTIGDKWGGVTIRLFKTAQREAQVYERNRERLFEIGNMDLRTRIHSHFLVETFPIEAIIDNTEEINHINVILNDDIPETPEKRQALHEQMQELIANRERALTSLREEHAKTCAICDELEEIGGVKFAPINTDDTVAPAATVSETL